MATQLCASALLPLSFPSSLSSSSSSSPPPRRSRFVNPRARCSSSSSASSPSPTSVSSSLSSSTLDTSLSGIPHSVSSSDNGLFSFARVLSLSAALSPLLLDTREALAAGGEFGILEGRTLALVHPIVMGGLFVYTLWAGYLGWQWRRVRTIQDEINTLKKDVKPAEEGAPPSPVELQIKELTEARKELVKGGYKDRHFNAGSILLAFGVLEAVGGSLNTWFRTGKLFPGPHLFAGAGITVLWALAAALVPAMQKGSDTARSLHIALNAVNVLLFIWQIPTGWEIVLKVFQFTTWP